MASYFNTKYLYLWVNSYSLIFHQCPHTMPIITGDFCLPRLCFSIAQHFRMPLLLSTGNAAVQAIGRSTVCTVDIHGQEWSMRSMLPYMYIIIHTVYIIYIYCIHIVSNNSSHIDTYCSLQSVPHKWVGKNNWQLKHVETLQATSKSSREMRDSFTIARWSQQFLRLADSSLKPRYPQLCSLVQQIDLDALLMQHDATMCSMFSYFSDFFSVTLKRVRPVRQLSNRFARAKSVATGCHGCLAQVTVKHHPSNNRSKALGELLLQADRFGQAAVNRPCFVAQSASRCSEVSLHLPKSRVRQKKILLRNPTARNLQEYDNKKTVLLLWFHGPLTHNHTIETATRTLRSAFRIQLPVAHAPSRICMSLTTSKLNKGNYLKKQCNRLNFKTSRKTGCIGCMWVSVSWKLRYLEIKGWLKGHTFITFRNSIKGTATSAGPNMVQSSSTSRNLGGPIWPSCNKFLMSSGKLSAKQLAHRCSSKLCLLTTKLCCCQTRYWIDWWLLMAWFAWGVTSVLIDNQHVRTRTCNRPSSPRIQQFCGWRTHAAFFEPCGCETSSSNSDRFNSQVRLQETKTYT